MASGGRRGSDDIDELLIIDFAGSKVPARLPHNRAGAGALAMVPAVEHGTAGKHDGGEIDGCRRHDAGRRGLVATSGENDTVERITVKHLDKAKIGEIAVQGGSGTFAGFLDGVDGEFDGNTASSGNAVPDTFSQFQMMAVARRKVAARLRNADDRLAGAQFVQGQTVIQVAFKV